MKKYFICLILVLLPLEVWAQQCVPSYPGLVLVQRNKISFARGRYLKMTCDFPRSFYLYWYGGNVCKNGYVFLNYKRRAYACKITKVR